MRACLKLMAAFAAALSVASVWGAEDSVRLVQGWANKSAVYQDGAKWKVNGEGDLVSYATAIQGHDSAVLVFNALMQSVIYNGTGDWILQGVELASGAAVLCGGGNSCFAIGDGGLTGADGSPFGFTTTELLPRLRLRASQAWTSTGTAKYGVDVSMGTYGYIIADPAATALSLNNKINLTLYTDLNDFSPTTVQVCDQSSIKFAAAYPDAATPVNAAKLNAAKLVLSGGSAALAFLSDRTGESAADVLAPELELENGATFPAAGLTLDFDSFAVTGSGLSTLSGAYALPDEGTALSIAGGATLSVAAANTAPGGGFVLSGAGALRAAAGGAVTVSDASAFTGCFELAGGSLALADPLSFHGTYVFPQGLNTFDLSGRTCDVNVTGGHLHVVAATDYAGTITVSGGTLRLANRNVLPAGCTLKVTGSGSVLYEDEAPVLYRNVAKNSAGLYADSGDWSADATSAGSLAWLPGSLAWFNDPIRVAKLYFNLDASGLVFNMHSTAYSSMSVLAEALGGSVDSRLSVGSCGILFKSDDLVEGAANCVYLDGNSSVDSVCRLYLTANQTWGGVGSRPQVLVVGWGYSGVANATVEAASCVDSLAVTGTVHVQLLTPDTRLTNVAVRVEYPATFYPVHNGTAVGRVRAKKFVFSGDGPGPRFGTLPETGPLGGISAPVNSLDAETYAPTIVLEDGADIAFSATPVSIPRLEVKGAGTSVLSGSQTLAAATPLAVDVAAGATLSSSAETAFASATSGYALSGAGTFAVSGGNARIADYSAFTGTLALDAGTVEMPPLAGFGGAVTVTGGQHELDISEYDGAVTVSGGTLRLAKLSDFTGTITVSDGMLRVPEASRLPKDLVITATGGQVYFEHESEDDASHVSDPSRIVPHPNDIYVFDGPYEETRYTVDAGKTLHVLGNGLTAGVTVELCGGTLAIEGDSVIAGAVVESASSTVRVGTFGGAACGVRFTGGFALAGQDANVCTFESSGTPANVSPIVFENAASSAALTDQFLFKAGAVAFTNGVFSFFGKIDFTANVESVTVCDGAFVSVSPSESYNGVTFTVDGEDKVFEISKGGVLTMSDHGGLTMGGTRAVFRVAGAYTNVGFYAMASYFSSSLSSVSNDPTRVELAGGSVKVSQPFSRTANKDNTAEPQWCRFTWKGGTYALGRMWNSVDWSSPLLGHSNTAFLQYKKMNFPVDLDGDCVIDFADCRGGRIDNTREGFSDALWTGRPGAKLTVKGGGTLTMHAFVPNGISLAVGDSTTVNISADQAGEMTFGTLQALGANAKLSVATNITVDAIDESLAKVVYDVPQVDDRSKGTVYLQVAYGAEMRMSPAVSPAAVGELRITDVPDGTSVGPGWKLPVTFGAVTGAGLAEGWKVYVNGRRLGGVRPLFNADGTAELAPGGPGFMLFVR